MISSRKEGSNLPITLQQIKLVNSIHEQFDNLVQNNEEERQKCKRQLPTISIADLIRCNTPLVELSTQDVEKVLAEQFIKYDIDRLLAQHFPLLGVGTEAIVFDIGTCVIKRRVCDSRSWEPNVFQIEQSHPRMFSAQITVRGPLERIIRDGREQFIDSNNPFYDYELQVQEKLTPVDPTKYIDQIRELYYPDSDPITFGKATEWGLPQFVFWEWGVDDLGVPHVFDWG